MLDRFIKDMKAKKIIGDNERYEGIDLAMLIMKNYIVYPVDKNEAVLPFNYCMIPKLAPKEW